MVVNGWITAHAAPNTVCLYRTLMSRHVRKYRSSRYAQSSRASGPPSPCSARSPIPAPERHRPAAVARFSRRLCSCGAEFRGLCNGCDYEPSGRLQSSRVRGCLGEFESSGRPALTGCRDAGKRLSVEAPATRRAPAYALERKQYFAADRDSTARARFPRAASLPPAAHRAS